MAKFRKKPVIIEAFKWNGGDEVIEWARSVSDGNGTSMCYSQTPSTGKEMLTVKTLEGVMEASLGDVVICGVNGEFYFCKPDIFEKTYEAVNG